MRELWREARVRSLAFDVVVAAAFAWLTLSTSRGVHWPIVAVPAVFAVLVVRRRWPLAAVLVTSVAMLIGASPLPAVFALYTAASRRGATLLTWLSGAAVCATFAASYLIAGDVRPSDWKYLLLAMGLFLALPLLAGLWMYQRRTLEDALRGRAEQAERERDLLAQRAVAAERRRIAGEMHDVVAHRVSVIAVQAGALSVIGDEQVVGIGEVIRKNSTTALSELRDMLRVLRDDPARDGAAHGIESIGDLVADSRSAGAEIDVRLPDPLPDAPAQVSRAAFRVVQEALTNIGKHAPGARADISVTAWDGELVVEVCNPAATAAPTALPSSGFGLISMRERVSLAGGTVDAGPTDDGYRVRAVFPLRGPTNG